MITRGWGWEGWMGEGWRSRQRKAETLWKKVLRPDLGLLKGINNWIPN